MNKLKHRAGGGKKQGPEMPRKSPSRSKRSAGPRRETKGVDPLALTPSQEIVWGKVLAYPGAEEALSKFGDLQNLVRGLLLEMPLDPMPQGWHARYASTIERKIPSSKQRKQARRWAWKILMWGYDELKAPAADLLRAVDHYDHHPPKRSYPAQVELVEVVKQSTGRFFFNQLATLLTATYHARGRKNFQVTEEGLRAVWRREYERNRPEPETPAKPQTDEEIKADTLKQTARVLLGNKISQKERADLVARIRKIFTRTGIPPEIEEIFAQMRSSKPN